MEFDINRRNLLAGAFSTVAAAVAPGALSTAQAKPASPMTVTAYGDSIAAGVGGNRGFTNLGIPGAGLYSGHYEDLEDNTASIKRGYVIVSIGTNDVASLLTHPDEDGKVALANRAARSPMPRKQAEDNFVKDLTERLLAIKAKADPEGSGSRVILLGTSSENYKFTKNDPVYNKQWNDYINNDMNALLARAADNAGVLISPTKDRGYARAGDGLHYQPSGYAAMTVAALKQLRESIPNTALQIDSATKIEKKAPFPTEATLQEAGIPPRGAGFCVIPKPAGFPFSP